MSALRFQGKVSIVTGGNSGIGLGVAKAYALYLTAPESAFIVWAELMIDGGMATL
jgi:hypothetical protein